MTSKAMSKSESFLYRNLVRWAKTQAGATYIVEAETGRELTYAQMLAAVNEMRQLLGDTQRCLVLALPGGIANAVVWISALSSGHQLVPLSQEATSEEKARVAQIYRPDVLVLEQARESQGFACSQAKVITRQMCDALVELAGREGSDTRSTSLSHDQSGSYETSGYLRHMQGACVVELVGGRVCLRTSGTT